MKRFLQRLVAILLTVALGAGVVPVMTMASEAQIRYTEDEDGSYCDSEYLYYITSGQILFGDTFSFSSSESIKWYEYTYDAGTDEYSSEAVWCDIYNVEVDGSAEVSGPDDNDEYTITPTETGNVTLYIYYNTVEGTEDDYNGVYQILLQVIEKDYYVSIVSDLSSDSVLTGSDESITFSAFVGTQYYNDEGLYVDEEYIGTEKIEYEWRVSYDSEVKLSYSAQNSDSLTLTIDEDSGKGKVHVSVEVYDEIYEGDVCVWADFGLSEYTFELVDGYYEVEVEDSYYVNSGETVTISPTVYYVTANDKTLAENVEYYLTWEACSSNLYVDPTFEEWLGVYFSNDGLNITIDSSFDETEEGWIEYWLNIRVPDDDGDYVYYEWVYPMVYVNKTNSDTCDHVWDDGVVTVEPTTDSTGTMTYTCTICGETKTEEIAKLEADLTITAQPEDQCVELGSTATFTVTADGDDLTYQWQWSGNSGKTWNNSSSSTTGYNTDTLKVTATAGRNGYQYRCVVTDGNGNSVTSDTATLTLAEEEKELAITGQPEDQVVESGSTATFTVTAEGTGLTYQWQWSGNSGKTWNNSSSSTTGYNTDTLKVTMTTGRNGYQYRCVVTDGDGNSVTSDAATLTLAEEEKELAITGQPEDQVVELGSTATFTVTAEGTGLTYQWQWSGNSGKTWNNSSASTTGYNTDTLKVTATAARNGYQYRCVITDSNGSSATSEAATLALKEEETELTITGQPEDQTVELGSTASFTLTADGNGLTYQWQWSGNSGKTWNNSSSATTGYNTDTLKVTATSGRNGYMYRCIVTDKNGNSITSEAATLTVAASDGL